MKLKLLKPIHFRDKKLKEGDVVEIPEGLAQKLILDGIATKGTAAEAQPEEETPKEQPKKRAKK